MWGSIAGALAALAFAAGAARADIELVVASYPSFDASVRLAIPRFEALNPGVKVKLVSLAYGDHHNAMITALASGTNLPDVMGVDLGFIGRFAETGGLEDLGAPPYGGRPLLEKLLKFTRSQALAGRGTLVVMPADVGPGTLLYRKDLLDRAGVTEEELTRSWESYLDAGKRIKEATGAYLLAHANDIESAYVRADLKDGENPYVTVDAKGSVRPAVPTARFRRAFELAKRARDAGLDAKIGAWSNEWAKGLRDGTIATVMNGSWLTGHLGAWIAPETQGLWRATQLPGGAFVTYGGSFYAIPRQAVHKAEAWRLVRFLCLDRQQQVEALRKLDAWPALLAAQDDHFVDEPMTFLGGQRARRLWKLAASRASALAVRKVDPAAEDVVNRELEQVLEKDEPIEQALQNAQCAGLCCRAICR